MEAAWRHQCKAEIPRCVCENALESRGLLHIQAGPQRSSWRRIRVSAEQRPRQGFRPPCNCGGSPSKGQDQSLWPGNAYVCPVLSLLTRELHSEEGLLHSGAGELGNSFSPNQGPSRALQGELRKHSTRRTVWNLDVL